MSEALINLNIVRWAAERAKVSATAIAKSVGVKVDKVQAWLSDESRPTFRQAQKLAHVLRIPFGYLYLVHPPEEPLPIPDLRTVGDQIQHVISPELRDVLSDVMRKQNWYRDFLLEQGAEPLPFIGKYRSNSLIGTVAGDITETLDLALTHRNEARDWEAFLRLLMDKAEAAGIWIMRNGIVGHNTHRPLNVEEFRGFAICDSVTPLVFINGKDAKAAQIFTLIHELTHLWIGESGISDVPLGSRKDDAYPRIERFCNTVAAQVLVPERVFRARWDTQINLTENANQLAHYFRVSTVMIARRAYDLDLIKWADYSQFYHAQVEKWRGSKGSGGDYYRNIRARNGKRFTEAVLNSTREGRLLLRDAGYLLNINPSKIGRLSSSTSVE